MSPRSSDGINVEGPVEGCSRGVAPVELRIADPEEEIIDCDAWSLCDGPLEELRRVLELPLLELAYARSP